MIINKKNIDKIMGGLLIALSYLGCIFSLNSNPFSNFLPFHDSSMFIYFGKAMAQGYTPYVDMFDHKGIVLFWIEQLGVSISQNSVGIWLVEISFLLITFIFLIKTVKLFTKNLIIAGMSLFLNSWIFISASQGGNFSETYALAFISISLFLFSKFIFGNKLTNLELSIIGITGALTFFTRANMISLWIVMCIAILIKLISIKQYKELLRIICWIFLGGVLVCGIIVVYGLVNNSLSEMFYQTFKLNIQYSSGNGILDKYKTAVSFILYMKDNNILIFLAFTVLIYALCKEKKLKNEIVLFYLLIVYAIVTFMMVILSGRYYLHYFIIMIPPLVILFGLAFTWLQRNWQVHTMTWLMIGVVIFTLGNSVASGMNIVVDRNISTTNQKLVSLETNISRYIKNNSKSQDKIYVHALNANIYLLSNRFSNSKFFVLPSLDYTKFPDLQKEFKEDMVSNPPKFIVLKKSIYESSKLDDQRMNETMVKLLNANYSIVNDFKNTDQMLFELK